MDSRGLGRRRVLSGGLALASAGALSGTGTARPAAGAAEQPGVEWLSWDIEECEAFGPDDAEQAARHAPFRAEFLAWLEGASGRFALPVAAQAGSAWRTDLHIPGLHPALEIAVGDDTQINVFVNWAGVWWDILASLDVCAEQAAGGWFNALNVPEWQLLRPTREACWRADGFELLLDWVNGELAGATHLVLHGDGGWTEAQLARDGRLLRSGRPIEDGGRVRHVLTLFGEGV